MKRVISGVGFIKVMESELHADSQCRLELVQTVDRHAPSRVQDRNSAFLPRKLRVEKLCTGKAILQRQKEKC